MDSIDRTEKDSIEKSNVAIDHSSSISTRRIHFRGGGGVKLLVSATFLFFFFFKANRSLVISVCVAKLERCWERILYERSRDSWRDKIEVVDREEFLMDFFFFLEFKLIWLRLILSWNHLVSDGID